MVPEQSQRLAELVHEALRQSPSAVNGWLADRCTTPDELANALTITRAATYLGSGVDDFPNRPASANTHAGHPTYPARPTGGHILGHYELLQWIGAGGMGEVFRARDLALGREAALKLLPRQFTASLRTLLVREAEACSRLQHPAIATFYEAADAGGETFIAMEYVEGQTLRKRCDQGALSLDDALSIATCLLEALEHAHAAGILHCDVKPENVITPTARSAKLLDFGIARHVLAPTLERSNRHDTSHATDASRRLEGTIAYMAPEQLLGESLDARTDVFQVGVVLYEMLSGRRAFTGNSLLERLASVLSHSPDLDALSEHDIPADLVRVVSRAMARDRADRYGSATAFLRDLQDLARGRVVTAVSQSVPVARVQAIEAEESFARARLLLDQLGKGTVEQAIELLERAVSIDPEHAPALAALAWAYGFRSIATTDPADLERALGYADRAIDVDSRNSEAHMWRGYVLLRRGEYDEAARACHRAAELATTNAPAPYFAGCALLFGGRSGEALPYLQRSLELDGNVGMGWLALGAAHLSQQHLREAHYSFNRARELEDAPVKFPTAGAAAYLAEVLRLQGGLKDARDYALRGLEAAERSDHAYRDFFRANALVVLGRTALDQADVPAALAAFRQVLGQAEGRPQTRSCGQLVVQALAGLARAADRPELITEGQRLFDAGVTYNFEPFFGALNEQTLFELAAAADAMGQVQDAHALLTRARGAGSQRALERMR